MKRMILYVGFLIMLSIGGYGCSSSTGPEGPQTNPPIDSTKNQANPPKVKSVKIMDLTKTGATVQGKVIKSGSSFITERGACWDTSGIPTVKDSHAMASSVQGGGKFSVDLTNLAGNTTYVIRTYAKNKAGIGYSDTLSFTTVASKKQKPKPAIVFVDSTSFNSKNAFLESWNWYYPWGQTHNGTALMTKDQISFQPNGVLLIEADRGSGPDHDPPIHFHSGTFYLGKKITVNGTHPEWIIMGDFKVPTKRGLWPALWLTGADKWPPEIDIMEIKGSNTIWNNSASGPSWRDVNWKTNGIVVEDASTQWHRYGVILRKVSSTDITIDYYIDGRKVTTQTQSFVDKPFWLIIDFQTEGSSGAASSSLKHAEMKIKDMYIAAYDHLVHLK